ncbi:MAG: hypothetical protein ACK4R6_14405 [Spirosomataceae bacterium]
MKTLFLFFLTFPVWGQIKNMRKEPALEAIMQRILPIDQTDEESTLQLMEQIYQLYQSPLDINQVTAQDLRDLFLLSEPQISSFITYRTEINGFQDIYELQSIPDWPLELVEIISPLFKIKTTLQATGRPFFQRATEHYFLLRWDYTFERAKGYGDSTYLGSPVRQVGRYRWQHSRDFSFGFLFEKDPGEQKTTDYFSGHVQIQQKGNWKNILLGDYQVQFGQGLVLGAGFFVGKGGETIYTIRRSQGGIRPYQSFVESGYFRGAAATYSLDKWECTLFASHVRRDATPTSFANDSLFQFSSLSLTGNHRTETEINRRKNLLETNWGGNLTYSSKQFQIGMTLLHTLFNGEWKKSTSLANFHEFIGSQNTVGSVYYSLGKQNAHFFGEIAMSKNQRLGQVHGLVASLHPQWEWAVLWRNYTPAFHSFYGNGFAENSRTINEKGFYSGIKFLVSKYQTWTAFVDTFQFPWLRFGTSGPSAGTQYALRWQYATRDKKQFVFQIQRKQRTQFSALHLIDDTTIQNRWQALIQANSSSENRWIFQTRLVGNHTPQTQQSGGALLQDVKWKHKNWQIQGRIGYFHTTDFDARVYAFENDVQFAVSFPSLYGQGVRSYIVARWSVHPKIDIWARCARTQVWDRLKMGSGNDEINFPYKTDARLQIRYAFL